jgi:hypothetical protein
MGMDMQDVKKQNQLNEPTFLGGTEVNPRVSKR